MPTLAVIALALLGAIRWYGFVHPLDLAFWLIALGFSVTGKRRTEPS